MHPSKPGPLVAIACGGTGGHLFPGLAVGDEILLRGGRVLLLVSPKDIDQRVAGGLRGYEIVSLPAIGLTRGKITGFLSSSIKSFRRCRALFREKKPDAVLAMGGFTSAPPILAGWMAGAKTFIHEANTLPGKANRWLAHFADEAFVFFQETSGRLNLQKVEVTGMPVRNQFQPMEAASARMALGLLARPPVLLVMGGSQGASGINALVCEALPALLARMPDLQFIHLTGTQDFEKVAAAYKKVSGKALVLPFLTEMELALGAATLAVSRSGASSLAELAAMGLPSLLIPYPAATDDHQLFNALAFSESGASALLEQRSATGSILARLIIDLISDAPALGRMKHAIAAAHLPCAAERVAERILSSIPQTSIAQPSGSTRIAASLPLHSGESRAR